MSTLRITLEQDFAGARLNTVFHYTNLGHVLNNAGVALIMNWFKANIVPAINGVQSDLVANVSISGFAYNIGVSVPDVVPGEGAVASDVNGTFPPQIAMLVRKSVGQTYLTDGAILYTGSRPVRRGQVFLSGLPETFSSANGVTVPVDLADEWATCLLALVAGYPGGGGIPNYPAVVFSAPLGALPPSPSFPDGKPPRGYAIAEIEEVTPVRFTRLQSRID